MNPACLGQVWFFKSDSSASLKGVLQSLSEEGDKKKMQKYYIIYISSKYKSIFFNLVENMFHDDRFKLYSKTNTFEKTFSLQSVQS